MIFLKIRELSKNLKEKLKKLKEPYPLDNQFKLKLNLFMMEMIFQKNWPEPNSKNWIMIYSKKLWIQSNKL